MSDLGPRDFDPFRDQITDCHCAHCQEVSYALDDVSDFGGHRHMSACRALLDALRAGEHTHVAFQERVREAREAKAERLERAKAEGASKGELAAIERGYTKVRMSDFYVTGMGLGVGPRNTDS